MAFVAAVSSTGATDLKWKREQRNAIPRFAYDPSTTKYCAWWLDNDGIWTCPDITDVFGVSMVDFKRWNPSVVMPCDTLLTNQSFCIAGNDGRPMWSPTRDPTLSLPSPIFTIPDAPQTITVPTTIPVMIPVTSLVTTTVHTTVTSISISVSISTIAAPPPTPTAGSNGISTPVPYQPGMVENCKTFYLVQGGDTCVDIAARYHIAPEQLVAWNPYAKADCTRLLANTYCCVGVL
ncbi:hypothetical protein B0H63DRAFT_520479 [Podospora didyma]|uniref:LysM domain-containing protein n=1 Tax=Podospora didyma TaxID=330526 RepID=A0AAE0U5L2_9PEZI|nr:hypothetical protein B0H63DRAFT_520479 [Podospora didyma]